MSEHNSRFGNGVIRIERCPGLISFSNGSLPPNLRSLKIFYCENLRYLVDERENLNINSKYLLEELEIHDCKSFISLSAKRQLALQVVRLTISKCKNLQCLLDERENISLEQLDIEDCKSWISLSARAELLMGLKYLHVSDGRSLESIAHEIQDNSSLERMIIDDCEELRSLPHGLDKLNHLEKISIERYPNLISFPGSGLLTPKLIKLHLFCCEKLEALPNCMHNIVSLEELSTYDCPSVVSFPEEGFTTNLISIEILQPIICKSVIEWGLHKLTFLKHFLINGASLDVVSFPYEEMLQPPSLTSFTISNFPNLESLSSKGFQNLTSLESLDIEDCPKLKFLSRKEMFPSLLEQQITNCPLLY